MNWLLQTSEVTNCLIWLHKISIVIFGWLAIIGWVLFARERRLRVKKYRQRHKNNV